MSPGTIDGFVSLDELTKMLDLCPNGMRRRLKAAGVTLYSDPFDRRRRLIKAADLPAVAEPLPIPQVKAGGNAAAISG